MSWVVFAFLTAVCFAISNVIDKYFLTRWQISPLTPTFVSGFIGVISSGAILLTVKDPSISRASFLYAAGGGAVFMTSIILYFFALKLEEVSRIISILYLTPLFTLLLALIFLDEHLLPRHVSGILCLVVGAFVLSFDGFGKLRSGKALALAISSALLFAVNAICIKLASNEYDYWVVYSYWRIGYFAALIPFFAPIKKDIIRLVQQRQTGAIVASSISEIIGLTGAFFSTAALSLGDASRATALSSAQPLIVLLIAYGVSRISPHALDEGTVKKDFFKKLAGVILIVAGAVLVV